MLGIWLDCFLGTAPPRNDPLRPTQQEIYRRSLAEARRRPFVDEQLIDLPAVLARSNELLAEVWAIDSTTVVKLHISIDGIEFSLQVMQGCYLAYEEVTTLVR